MEFFISGLLFGLGGSLHCVGMCGPLIMARHQLHQRWWHEVLYHFFRTMGYLILGGLVFAFGKSLSLFITQQLLSLLSGIFLFISVWFTHVQLAKMSTLLHWISAFFMKSSIKTSSWKKSMLWGLGNGFLPCGFLYLALVVVLNLPHRIDGFIYMLGFGLSTSFPLLGLSYVKPLLHERLGKWFSSFTTWVTVLMAVLLIFRGLGLGIPYLSPVYKSEPACCAKH
ncbi:MAG: sulfite exporter TauE/SafE family protein [Chitinophagales bacterium]|jgi:hypothetical protein|nr:sulfite exporter TauE/SafE family protein [Chitinophagales bacterium]